ncbi:hypothetical protein IL54_1511 [Sphingobium sp. ba1]|uniref:hypothetical protein n=1 Tax=Sphingobium sp. ba1 TaxID=1522072 RepID=UPI0005061CB2|nr:hypothetical protein [Sphingobium sp. ba1]KFL46098.1 hypothetical protein IL54_1511 [Sphingobium sp. ba1]
MSQSPMWIATREGQDWLDEDVLAAIDWLTSMVSAADWEARMGRVRAMFAPARDQWPSGARPPLYDPGDLIAWYVFQANAYASDRANLVEQEAYRIAPVFRRLGQLLPSLKLVIGVENRVRRMMIDNRTVPDDALYELLVAGAYASRGWSSVKFVPEDSTRRTPDLHVSHEGIEWAVECTRTGRSDYMAQERAAGDRLAQLALEETECRVTSISVEVIFEAELANLPERYLADRVATFLEGGTGEWRDESGYGWIKRADLRSLRAVLRHDDIIFGASRMIELLMGQYIHAVDYRMAGAWTPAPGRPFHATAVARASVVGWVSASEEAARRKATHFRALVADKSGQLNDRPGVLHVGYETTGGNAVEGLRHQFNLEQMETFEPRGSTLEWVYGNYMLPEHVTARMESAALTETTAIYPIKGHQNPQPLPNHMLFLDDEGTPGHHFPR